MMRRKEEGCIVVDTPTQLQQAQEQMGDKAHVNKKIDPPSQMHSKHGHM